MFPASGSDAHTASAGSMRQPSGWRTVSPVPCRRAPIAIQPPDDRFKRQQPLRLASTRRDPLRHLPRRPRRPHRLVLLDGYRSRHRLRRRVLQGHRP